MKTFVKILVPFTLSMFIISEVLAQPEFKSDVQKEYDENGNITRFDSCWSWSYKGGHELDLDSVFSSFFHRHKFQQEWEHFPAFPDSVREYSQHFNFPDPFQPFVPHIGFPDQFPDGFHGRNFDSIFSIPFTEHSFYDENLDDFFEDFRTFQNFENHFREHMDRIKKYFDFSPFEADTILYYQYRRPPPDHQKNSLRSIEI